MTSCTRDCVDGAEQVGETLLCIFVVIKEFKPALISSCTRANSPSERRIKLTQASTERGAKMVFYCCAYNCKNNTKDKSLTFHSFPLGNPSLLKKWLRNMRWKDWSPEEYSKICSNHFESKCYRVVNGTRRLLHTWAVPTIFSFPGHLQNQKKKIDPRSRRALGTVDESVFELPSKRSKRSNIKPVPVQRFPVQQFQKSQPSKPSQPSQPSQQLQPSQQSQVSNLQKPPEPSNEPESVQVPTPSQSSSPSLGEADNKSCTWTILGDESVDRSMTMPSFFHSGYCLPRSFCWDGDDELNIMPHVVRGIPGKTKLRIIEIKERWEWLGLDIRGPFPITTHKHTHVMTLTDYYSKWVEIFPLTQNKTSDAAACLAEAILQMGYPLGVLSRLPKHLLLVMNRDLKKHLKVDACSLVIHHRQTGYLDLVTEALLNEMVDGLIKEYPRTWHIHLPAASLRLCCKQHPTTGKKPFTVMYSSGPPAFRAPRELPFSNSEIRQSSFIIPHIEAAKGNKENTPVAGSAESEMNIDNTEATPSLTLIPEGNVEVDSLKY
ncbi:hypothetical protein AMEX_G22105 [Astyanax mexicanus]|uniref:THAP domain-containing protein 1 n=1 Tax=Astyanax mexicanus TaxID=7994 RepID=A0A8T2KZ40_ASTMX|nr:hypothetical protein AMEX_G22105 [Astyanax mexicanus]